MDYYPHKKFDELDNDKVKNKTDKLWNNRSKLKRIWFLGRKCTITEIVCHNCLMIIWKFDYLPVKKAMNERHQEIGIHKEMLDAQYRAASAERQQISAELHERISKIEKLKSRSVYHVVLNGYSEAHCEI